MVYSADTEKKGVTAFCYQQIIRNCPPPFKKFSIIDKKKVYTKKYSGQELKPIGITQLYQDATCLVLLEKNITKNARSICRKLDAELTLPSKLGVNHAYWRAFRELAFFNNITDMKVGFKTKNCLTKGLCKIV